MSSFVLVLDSFLLVNDLLLKSSFFNVLTKSLLSFEDYGLWFNVINKFAELCFFKPDIRLLFVDLSSDKN